MTLKQAAISHMQARWLYLGKMNWQGKVSWETYRSANLQCVMRNLAANAYTPRTLTKLEVTQ